MFKLDQLRETHQVFTSVGRMSPYNITCEDVIDVFTENVSNIKRGLVFLKLEFVRSVMFSTTWSTSIISETMVQELKLSLDPPGFSSN